MQSRLKSHCWLWLSDVYFSPLVNPYWHSGVLLHHLITARGLPHLGGPDSSRCSRCIMSNTFCLFFDDDVPVMRYNLLLSLVSQFMFVWKLPQLKWTWFLNNFVIECDMSVCACVRVRACVCHKISKPHFDMRSYSRGITLYFRGGLVWGTYP